MQIRVITKKGELSAMYNERQFNIAVEYAKMHNGKVIDKVTGEVLYDACKEKHFTEEKNGNKKN